MKAMILTLILVLCFGAFAFWNIARTNHSWQVSAFGESTVSRPDEDAYFGAAAAALDQFLRSRGYGPANPVPTPLTGIHSAGESSVAYRSSPSAPEPVTVVVTISKSTASGLSAHVFWEFVGFRWAHARHEALAREAIEPISAWWKEYTEKHPRH